MKEQQICSFGFLEGDSKWRGAVEVLRCTSEHSGKVFIGLRLRIGDRYINLPRRGTEEIATAISNGISEAKTSYKNLLLELNEGPK